MVFFPKGRLQCFSVCAEMLACRWAQPVFDEAFCSKVEQRLFSFVPVLGKMKINLERLLRLYILAQMAGHGRPALALVFH